MKGTDVLLTLIIIVIFIALFAINILAVGIENIKKKWAIYRCNPTVMPFAGVFGQNTVTNFAYCIQNLQATFMQELLAPLHYVESVMGDVTKELLGGLQAIRAFFDKIRNFVTNIIQQVMGVFLNFLIGIQRMIINVKDLFAKTIGTLTVLMFILDGSIMTMNSTWDGPPGQMMRMLCFHPNTLVKLNNGKNLPIKDIKSGSKLKNEQIVYGTMNLHNLDNDGNYIEKLYSIPYNKNCNSPESILVSGSHLIYDKELDKFIHVKDSKYAQLTDINTTSLICLITSDHTIPLGDHIFHDWEDNQGSPSKNV